MFCGAGFCGAGCGEDPPAGGGAPEGGGVEGLAERGRQVGDRILAEFDLDLETLRKELEEKGEVIRQRLGEIVEDVEEAVADTVLTARVRGVLLQDPDIPSLVIGVASRQGDVTLTGKVREIEHIQRALELTLAVPGVKRVRSRLILLEAGPPPKPPGATEQKK